MRRTVTRKLLQSQDICFFCAARYGIESRSVNSLRPQRRLYRAAASSNRPAGAAAARIEEDDDLTSTAAREVLGWKCRCNHVNKPGRSECTLCLASRPQKPELVYKNHNPSPPPPPPPPIRQPAPPANGRSREAPDGSPDLASLSTLLSRSQPAAENNREYRFQRNFPARQGNTQFGQPRSAFARDQSSPGNGMGKGGNDGDSATHPFSRNPDRPFIRFHGGEFGQDRGASSYPLKASNTLNSQRNETSERTLPRSSSGNWSRSLDRSSPAQPEANAKTEPVTWKPMARNPSRTSQESPAGQEQRYRGGFNNLPGQRQERVRPSRENGNARMDGQRRDTTTPGRVRELASVEVETAGMGEILLAAEEEDNWYQRKIESHKSRDRRARLYDIEPEEPEPVQASSRARLSTARRRDSRATSLDFDYDLDVASEYLEDQERKRKRKNKGAAKAQQKPARPEIVIPEFISVEKLAQGLKVRVPEFLEKLEEEGFEGARHDHVLDSGTSAMFAEIYGFEAIIKTVDDSGDIFPRPPAEDPSVLPPRPPVVTIMGHVDHGKTTILDYFRKANVVATEHGGITQHIGAFSVTMPGSERNITFLDTPGHAAFLEMRRRGAVVTDIVVLVVAADDSVNAQTIEAIKHAREAGVQMIIAINKVDKPEADVEKVKLDLTQHDIVVEDFGGDYQAIPVSGKTGQGMDDLEEAILTLADVADFRAEVDGQAEGWIIESRVGATGRIATVLVRRGTLRPGDFIVAGTTWARVRTLRDDAGDLIEEAPPGTPVQIDGWRGDDPEAGLLVLQAENEQQAKDAIAVRKEREDVAWEIDNMAAINATRAEDAAARAKVLQWEKEQGYLSMGYKRRPKDNEGWVEKESAGPQLVHFVIKADVAGSTEALVAAVSGIGNSEIRANIVDSGTGGLTESDIKMLAATGEVAYAISFNQPIDNEIRQVAAAARIQILDHNIIYKVTDDVTDKVAAELPPIVTQRVLGEAEVGDIFEIKVKKGSVKIAGCRVTNGTIKRSEKIRVLRDGEAIYTGTLNSFKNVKKDVTETRKGSECGMGFENWDDFEVGDKIQSFEEHSEKRTLH